MGILSVCKRIVSVAFVGIALSASLLASDAVQVGVTPLTDPGTAPLVLANGFGLNSGTYAIGTIQLWYTVVGTQFSAGQIASFQLDLAQVTTSTTGATPAYPVQVGLKQNGSANLVLGMTPSIFENVNVGWTGSSIITVTVPQSVVDDPSLNVDGTDLVGNLNISSSDSHLKTTTTVQVHVVLVCPTQCLHAYAFMTDANVSYLVLSGTLTVKAPKNNKPTTYSLTPPQLSDNLLVVNTCAEAKSFDLKFVLDPSFETNPHDNPGNAVFMSMASGAFTPEMDLSGLVATEIGKQQQLCLPNITLPGASTLLARVHNELADLTGEPTSPFIFTDTLHAVSTAACGGALLDSSVISQNPVILELPFTVSNQN